MITSILFQSLLINEQTICLAIRWIFVFTKKETWDVVFGIFENLIRRIRGQAPLSDTRVRDVSGRFIRTRRRQTNEE